MKIKTSAVRACHTPALVPIRRASAALLPNAKYVEIPGGPHGLPFTHRREIADRITSFLTGRD